MDKRNSGMLFGGHNGINLREHDSQGLMPFKLSISNTVMVLQWA